MASNYKIKGRDASAYLNSEIDCEDLAHKLGMEQPRGQGNWRSPHHPDKSPSVKIYPGGGGKNSNWHDFSSGKSGGVIDLYMWHAESSDFVAAVKELMRMFGLSYDKPNIAGQPRAEPTRAEYVASKCVVRSDDDRATLVDYLESRKISRSVIDRAIDKGTLGLNTWVSDKVRAGEIGYGGPGAAFIVRAMLTNAVMAVDVRYIDAALNGGVKSGSQGEKAGWPWCSDWRRLAEAQTVYVVESSINALSIETCAMPRTAALAVRGTGNVDSIDWSFLRGKQVVACFDNDQPAERGPMQGYCPGAKAAWRLHEVLSGLDISCVLVDQSTWWADEDKTKPINDVNDWLQLRGVAELETALKKLETWMIPGMSADGDRLGKPRVWLPQQDYHAYWKYRATLDFTRAVSKVTKAEEEGEPDRLEFADVAGFRVAALARVSIASDESMMTGNSDNAPTQMYALSVQVPRHGPVLQRVVVEDQQLHNLDVWKKLGPIYAPSAFSRMINIWERASHIGSRDAINFVGLAWRGGRLQLNEGADCFFTEPIEQCPYHNLTFPSGAPSNGVEVMREFAGTFADNEVTIPLVWALGAHLKAFLGYWPHFVIQADKGAGKSAVVKALGTALAMKQYSRQTLQTEYRIIGSVSYTSQPVAWGEFSTNKQELRTKAIGTLQESYQYESTSRGVGLRRKFLMSAPVLLSGEDVPVDGLEGKIVRSTLTLAKRGPMITPECPLFPMRQWLQWLARQNKKEVMDLHAEQVELLQGKSAAKADDAGASRMVINYASVATSWHLLCAFLDMPTETGHFLRDLTRQMNQHITETKATRHPWVWIVEKLLSEIARREFKLPYRFDVEDEVPVLCIRSGHVMDHISQSSGLRAFWDELPIKSASVFKKQLVQAGVLALGKDGLPLDVERTVGSNRVSHMMVLMLPALEQFGLHAVVPKGGDDAPGHGGGFGGGYE